MSPVRTGDAAAWFRWDPDRVAAAVAACPGVTRLVAAPTPAALSIPARPSASPCGNADPAARTDDATAEVTRVDAARDRFGGAEVATYLPGRRVAGVRVRADRILVQVDCRYGEPLPDLAGRIRAAVRCAAPDCPRVDVVIRDLDPADGPASVDPRTPIGGRSPTEGSAPGGWPLGRGAGDPRLARSGDDDQPWVWPP
ncbi:hypothetical protein FF36_00563 [Frankia torreyi]|uniref:Asp23 family n=1 Tax=Frankia torreyi TaxID=1856 RepID=A0A0D8BNH6_9ACTN|nr:hypothetical protein [Frankia torreyi]KJE24952.1 hypothetical protein FF36_00563 [Frankia torreyi]